MRSKTRATLPLGLMCLLIATGGAGCARPSASEVSQKSNSRGASEVESSETAATTSGVSSAVRVELGDLKTLDEIVARHRGKVVVVDFWSTWCAPCVAEFPHLVELQRDYGARVACISVNCNFAGASEEPPSSFRAEVEQFLREKQAHFEHLISTVADTELFDQLQVASVPVVRVYGVDGKLAKQFVNDNDEYGEEGFRYSAHIRPVVDELLQTARPETKSE